MSDVIKKLDDSLENSSRIFNDCKESFDRFERLIIGTNMNPNVHFVQNNLQESELHVKVNQLSSPSPPSEHVELNKHVTHLVASSASITRVFDLLRVILSNQTHLKMLVQHLLSTRSSNKLQNLPYQHDPLWSISQHLSLDYLSKAFPNEASQDHTTSAAQLFPTTPSGTMPSNSPDDPSLTGSDLTDIFGSKSYIPGSVSFPCSTFLEEVTSLNSHSRSTAMNQNKPSSNPSVAATASSRACSASTAESTTKRCCKEGKFQRNKSKPITGSALTSTLKRPTTRSTHKAIPRTPPAIGTTKSLINAQTHRRSSKKASHLSSSDVQSSVIPDCKGPVLQPFGPTERDIAVPVLTEARVSKGKKRTWDFSSDEEAEDT